MNDLERKVSAMLADHARHVRGSPSGWARINQRLATDNSAGRPRRPMAMAVAAVVVVVGTLAVAAWLDGGRRSVAIDPATEATQPSSAATTPATERPSDEASEPPTDHGDGQAGAYAWRETGTAVGDLELWVRDVYVDGRQIVVAAGGALWRSTDGGATWDELGGEAFDPPGPQTDDIRAVTGTPEGLVAVGGTHQQGVVWRSSDGARWQRTPLGDAGLLYDVTDADGRLVATGRSGSRAAAYVSTNGGQTWERSEVEAAGEGPENGMFVVAHGPAGWVASGYGAGNDGLATFWTSPDARSWSLVSDAGVAGETGVIDAIGSNESGYVALRAGGDVYRSTDARQWTRAANLGPADGPGEPALRFGGVTATPQGWLAVGGRHGTEHSPQAYTSPDGVSWAAEMIAERGDARGLAVAPDGTAVVVGQSEEACAADQPCPTLVGWQGALADE